MKTRNYFQTIMIMIIFVLMSCNQQEENISLNNGDKTFIILVKYKAQPGKGNEAVAGLIQLIEKVKYEPNFINIKLHVDPKDNSNILLYEEWSNETYYNSDHMRTPHLQKFMQDSRSYLAGPPEISQWTIKKSFSSK